ncbi:hypothetical protein Pcinc_002702 [Petrolisthes cinctipes]|uniref:Uncharacterized protein n=1 Tax=Petrolisthes cinctipes TaxID=88211 RepID=A0AAE1L2Q8_PETCI|nr:hypothetical protein Pcinc_002702 [Petrolisthes cinctipes]
MVIITVEDAGAFVKDDVTEAQVDQLSPDELVVQAEYLGFHDSIIISINPPFRTRCEKPTPLVDVELQFGPFSGVKSVGLLEYQPLPGINFLLGNDIARGEKSTVEDEASLDLNVLFDLPDGTIPLNNKELQGAKQLTNLQRKDPECSRLMEKAVSEEESKKELKECFFTRGDILYRRWKPS